MRILLVEDNEGDIELARVAFKKSKTDITLTVAHDGAEALENLRRAGNATLPDLILLDLNMPRMNGLQFLENIKKDAKLCLIPVIVLTSSNAAADIDAAYSRHANCYLLKPTTIEKFVTTAQSLDAFWGHLARLPSRAAEAAA